MLDVDILTLVCYFATSRAPKSGYFLCLIALTPL
jgi:hypothetical protein